MVAEGALGGSTQVWGVSGQLDAAEQVAELHRRPPPRHPHRGSPRRRRRRRPAAPKPSPHAALLQAAAAADQLKVHERNAAAQGDAGAAGAWRTFLDYLQGLIDQVGAPGAGAEVQEQADALKAAVGQVPPLG